MWGVFKGLASLMKTLFKSLLVLLFWLVATALLLEVALRAAAPSLPPYLEAAAVSVMQGRRYEINRLASMTTDDDHAFIHRPGLVEMAFSGSPEVSFHISTNALWGSHIGFRNRPIDYHVDAVVVGDSFSFCWTEYEDCWVHIFERETGLGVVNLAQSATGSYSHMRMISRYASPLEPRLVIWQFFGNDFYDDYYLFTEIRGEIEPIESPYGDTALPHARPPDGLIDGWLRRNSVAFVVLELVLFGDASYRNLTERLFFEESHIIPYKNDLLGIGQRYEQIALNMDDPRNQAGAVITRGALHQAQADVESWGGTLVVLLIPTREEVYEDVALPLLGPEVMDIYRSAREAMLGFCEELDVLCYDLLDDLRTLAYFSEELFYYSDDLHLNPAGNAVLAELLWGWLGGHGLLYP